MHRRTAHRSIIAAVALGGLASMLGCSDLGLESLRFHCRSSSECARGTVCDPAQHACVEPNALSDGGSGDIGGDATALDAHAQDAPSLDASPPDAAADAGPMDTRPDPCAACGVRGCESDACNRVTALALGSNHTCALISNGDVACWGSNQQGQLGDGRASGSLSTRPVLADIHDVTQISAGLLHTCALQRNGDVRCWGRNTIGQIGVSGLPSQVLRPASRPTVTGIAELATGKWQTTCSKNRAGQLYCWGLRLSGQGYPGGVDVGAFDPLPVRVQGFSGAISRLAIGSYHACAIIDGDDHVECWGNNYRGQIGDGTNSSTSGIARVLLDRSMITAIGLADQHSCAVRDGAAYCWGEAAAAFGDGQHPLGRTSTPRRITLRSGALQIGGGYRHTCALETDGAVECWGKRDDSPTGEKIYRSPEIIVGAEAGVHDLFVGWVHNCARMDDGAVKCWGDNSFGQLGNGGTVTPFTAATSVTW